MQSPHLTLPRESCSASQPRTALVLGAGGIRGCAHAGVISVLRQAGVRIDMVVGASSGAMFGLGLAAGISPEQMVETVRASRPIDIVRFYLGGLNPQGKNPIARLLRDAGEGKEFSDLEIPFAVAATDMETGLPVIINRGPVLDAVRASICLPFVARPVHIGGRYHLDGGLVDTAPVAAARELGAERVIAVCLGGNLRAPAWLRRRPWTRAALQRVGRGRRPGGTRLPDVLRFSARLCAACFDPPVPAQDADVLIWPDFGSLSPNSMFGAQFALQQGFEAARAAVLSYEL
jgi:predicted acylesterase/phospholipase RssA